MKRVHNFAPGPAALPLSVLERAREDLIDYRGTGISILEHSHRGAAYMEVHEETKALLREVLNVPESHAILFMQGGARGQFGLIPMNFLPEGKSADYVVTGTWGEKAIKEAEIVGKARLANPGAKPPFVRVPKEGELELDDAAAYLHLTSNNTIYGTQFHQFPSSAKAPMVLDMSSDIASRPFDISPFHLVYAGAQKNLGIPGVTLLFLDKNWIEEGSKKIPNIFQYRAILKGDSLQNTAPTFAIYTVRNMVSWIKESGGVAAMKERNQSKADLLYGTLDELDFYSSPVEKDSRSLMNVIFRLPTEELEKKLVAHAAENDMVGIKGHRSVGGIRVSLYNAIELAQVKDLTDLLRDFAQKNG